MTNADVNTPPTWEGQPYSIKRHGVSITNCDTEPIQTPGCIQAHGALLVLRRGDLTILQASENIERVIGFPPDKLLGHSVKDAIGERREARLRAVLSAEPTENNSLYVCNLPARGDRPAYDVTVHTSNGVVVVEFEVTSPRADSEPDYYALVKKTVIRLQEATTLRQFCHIVTADVRAFTGHDRVLVYKFHSDGHGEVVAESCRADLSPFLGLHYPAGDIPLQAREIFTKIWIRPLTEVPGELAELVPLVNPDTGKPLDMTHCALRGPSVMYTEYLQNMEVKAALTMSIRQGKDLWGMIACHHYAGPKPVPYQVRAACELLAQVVSLQHKAAQDREHFAYRLKLDDLHHQLVAAAARGGGLGLMLEGAPTLLDGMSAGGAALYYQGRWWKVGNTPTIDELDALGEWLNSRPEFESSIQPVYATDSLAREYPPAIAFAGVASGVLSVPLSRKRRNLIVWFRPETIQTVNWGGNPHEVPTIPGPNGPRLTPRRSFELFTESVRERSLPWAAVEIESAARLRLLVMDFVVSRSEDLETLNADLTRSNKELDAFAYVASHDLKEPLRGIHKYALQLLDEANLLSEEHRARLDGLMRFTLQMDGFIDSLLYFSRVGRATFELQETELQEVLSEATEMVSSRTVDVKSAVITQRPLPRAFCDRVAVREIFVNLLSNALKYTTRADKHIEVGYIDPSEPHARPGCPREAAHQRIFYVRDNGIGIERRYFEHVFTIFRRLHGRNEYGGGSGAGLSIVKKLIQRHGGLIWLESEPGSGTTVYFTLQPADGPLPI